MKVYSSNGNHIGTLLNSRSGSLALVKMTSGKREWFATTKIFNFSGTAIKWI